MTDKKLNYPDQYTYLDDLDEYINKSYYEAKEKHDLASNNKSKLSENSLNNTTLNKQLYKRLHDMPILEDQKEAQDPTEQLVERQRLKRLETDDGKFYLKDTSKIDTFESAVKELELEKQSLEAIDMTQFNIIKEKVVNEESSLLAFLNIEFNILNKKVINCNRKCFNNYEVTYSQANQCVSNCSVGISDAYGFADDQYKEMKSNLTTCLNDYNLNSSKERVKKFTICYDKLIEEMRTMKLSITEEFKNYI